MSDTTRPGDLVRAARDGSDSAWAELVDRFSPMIMAVARRHRLSAGDVDDVHQVVWLRLAENLDRVRDPDRIAGWLSTTARNESLNLLRRPPTDEFATEPADPDPVDPLAGVAGSDVSVAVAAGFAALSERCRELLRLLFVDELPYQDISDRIDLPVGSLGPTRQRCLQSLRAALPVDGAALL